MSIQTGDDRHLWPILALVLCLVAVGAVVPVAAQSPIGLDSVEPPQGRPGHELEVRLLGHGFGDARQVRVTIPQVEVQAAWVESDEVIGARLFIPEDAPPGPRPVQVVAVLGPNEEFAAELEAGFSVLEALPPAEARPAIYEVTPQEVAQGSEVALTLVGENFTPEAQVSVGGAGVEVYDWAVEDPSRLVVHIGVLPDAAPGPRPLVVETAGGRAELSGGLVVSQGAPPPGPTSMPAPTPTPADGTGGGSLVGLTGGALLIWTVGFAVGRALTLRSRLTWKRLAELQWQLEARTKLPEPKQACTWTCQADAAADLLHRWEVKALQLTPLPVSGGKTPPARQVAGDALKPLNEAARLEHILEDEERTGRRLAPVVDALLRQILAWGREGPTPAAIRVDARLARGIKWGFGLYHCEKGSTGPKWTERKRWKGTLHQPAGDCLGVLRGPMADEVDFAARMKGEIETLLLKLITGVRFKP